MRVARFAIASWIAASVLCTQVDTASAQDVQPVAAEAQPASTGTRIPRQNLFAQKYHFTLYEVEQFSERLGLSSEQREIFAAMFSEMQERVMEAERPIREMEAELHELFHDGFLNEDTEWRVSRERAEELMDLMDEIRERRDAMDAAWVAKQERMAAALFEDLKLLLSSEQIERFDEVIRWRHRARLLRWNELPYGKLMVSSIARSMELRPDPSRFGDAEASMLDEIYDEYERELDRLLLERAAVEREHAGLARGMGGNRKMIGIGLLEPSEVVWQKAVGEQNVRIVSMQKKYIGRIASLVEPEIAVAFQRRCREEAYPYVLMRSSAQQSLELLASDEHLSVEQRERVEQMLASHTSQRDAINERWVRMIDDLVANAEPRILASAIPLEIGDPHALRRGDMSFLDISAERKALDERWMERVRGLRAEFAQDVPVEAAR